MEKKSLPKTDEISTKEVFEKIKKEEKNKKEDIKKEERNKKEGFNILIKNYLKKK